MESGRVIVAERGRDPALSQGARGRAKRPFRENENPSFRGRAESRIEPSDARADDEEVDVLTVSCSVYGAHASFRL